MIVIIYLRSLTAMIIFSEDTHYQRLIENGFEKYPNKRDLTIIGKKWLDMGYTIEEIKQKIIDYCMMFCNDFSVAKSENLINSVLSALSTGNIPNYFNDTEITIYDGEISQIKKLADKECMKIAFILLCLAKYNKSNAIYLNSTSLIKISDIFNLAKIKCTKKKQYEILNRLSGCQFINVKMKPLLLCEIPIINNYDDTESFKVVMNDDIIQVWYDLIYPHCCMCGKGFEKKSNSQKYCKICAIKIKAENRKN